MIETGWLVVLHRPLEKQYWRSPIEWCTDAIIATRFARQMDADMVASTLKTSFPISTEFHEWDMERASDEPSKPLPTLTGYCDACRAQWTVTTQEGTDVIVKAFHCRCGHVTVMD